MNDQAKTIRAQKNKTPKIIAVVNQKGGVGKTTTAMNIGAAIAERGIKTVIIDLDPQGNASTGLGYDPKDRLITIQNVIAGKASINESVFPARPENLYLIPSSHQLSSTDITMANEERRLWFLKDQLSRSDLNHLEMKYVLIDCPPSINLLTLNAMVAADTLLVPLQAEFFALEGLSQLILSMREVRRSANPSLHLEGVVLTMVDRRNNLSQQVENDARKHLKNLVFKTVIPRSVRLSEAPSHGVPALIYDSRSTGSKAYRSLAVEILEKQLNQ